LDEVIVMTRKAIIPITYELLEDFFGMPKDMKIIGVYPNYLRNILEIKVEGPMFDEVPEGQECPRMNFTIKEVANYLDITGSNVPDKSKRFMFDEVN
jgi:hypothetical protein